MAAISVLHADMGTMVRMGIFENMTDLEFEDIESQLWEELMEDEEYRRREDRPKPREVLEGMFAEEAGKMVAAR